MRWVIRGSRLLPNGLVVLCDREKLAVGLATVWSGSPPGAGRSHTAQLAKSFDNQNENDKLPSGERQTVNGKTANRAPLLENVADRR